MKKVFVFHRNDSEKGRKLCVEVELKEGNVFTACCAGPAIYWGQCLDRAQKELNIKNPVMTEIVRLWRRWHCNDLHAGTPCQENLVKEYTKTHRYDYTDVCKFLEENNLLYDNGYKYGSAWLKEEIPQEDLEKIKELLAD